MGRAGKDPRLWNWRFYLGKEWEEACIYLSLPPHSVPGTGPRPHAHLGGASGSRLHGGLCSVEAAAGPPSPSVGYTARG